MSAIRTIITRETVTGGHINIFNIDDHEVFVYQPKDVMESDIINYGYSAPLLMVFGEERFTWEKAAEYAEETGLAEIASENGGTVVFANPLTDWDSEQKGTYELIINKTRISQWNFRYGMMYDDKIPKNRFQEEAMKRDPNFDHVPEYFIFGSPVACYVYGKGKGADYLARYYMDEIKGKAGMGDLGMADITMTAVTLENTSVVPEVTFSDVSIVSVGNSDEVNQALLKSDNRVAVCETLDVREQYDKYIGDYKRWAGKIRASFNCRKEGIVMKPMRMMVETSEDNHGPGITRPQHEAGFVIFYREDADLTDRNNPLPLVLCFHGGGDTAIATAMIGDWPRIARDNNFILCATEMHMSITANETMQIVERLARDYAIDTTRIYATGFSMGGIKSWDFYQEYPQCMAALAPMCATVDVGENTQFGKAARVNNDTLVPVFYVGGEKSPLAELPFQEGKCVNRMKNLFKVNRIKKEYSCRYEDKENWQDKVYGISGDVNYEVHDPDFPQSVTTVRCFESEDGNVYTNLVSVSNQMHEIRPNTCRMAWNFMKKFRRLPDGTIEITE